MDQWKNCVAVVTGASSGIGAQIAKDLAKHNVIVAALARREDRLNEIKTSVPDEFQKNFHCYRCDVTNYDELENIFNTIEKNLGCIKILINSAAVLKVGYLSKLDRNTIKEIMDTNVTSVIDCTRLAFKSMENHNTNGHIILINSIAGHKVLNLGKDIPMPVNFYPASKYAITAMTEIYRQEFKHLGTKIKISSVSPGLVETEMTQDQIKLSENYLQPKDISDGVLYILGTPPNVQVHELTIKPVGEEF